MRTLKYAILGLLYDRTMTGYELMKEFGSALNEFWYAKHSQIYPELKKLTAENLITYEIEISGTSLEKKAYSITETGKEEFMNWLCEPTEMEETPKSIFRLKLFFSPHLSVKEQEKMIETQLDLEEKRLAQLQKNQQKFKKIPPQEDPSFGDYMVLKGAIMREETNCRWLHECLDMIIE